jgi:hypothetical protein
MLSAALEKMESVRNALPAEGLFLDKDWLISPEPFPLDEKMVGELETLGHRLNLFNRACNQLYQLSVQGRQPAWVADYLDAGKPRELVEYSRQKTLRDELPRVIRPDVILTDDGFIIAELDNVPGGIGLTAWLNQTYSRLGAQVIGGPDGMIDGFRSIIPGGADILVSDEASAYRPEMQWLCGHLGDGCRVFGTEPRHDFQKNVYRFFELFDLPNIACAGALMESGAQITPPIKPYLEEKMWFALFWMRPLREFWRRELGEKHWLKLQQFIPYTWIVDPAPLPHHAVIPGLEIQDWRELAGFSQKQRELALKISGFSELAWGSRGISLGQDLPKAQWSAAIEKALAEFRTHPYLLQRFHKGRLVEHPYFDARKNAMATMQGRVRLCPYYFVIEGRAELRGVLATICPSDKKFLHGMKDAILAPCSPA